MQSNSFYNFMPFVPIKVQLSDGIHLVKRRSAVPFLATSSKKHFGVIVVGKPLRQLGYFDGYSRVFHLTNEGIQIELLPKTNNWELLNSVYPIQIQNAITRLNFAKLNSNYDLFSNNCEQFARYIVEGKKQSIQLQNFVGLSLLVGLFIWADSK